MNEPKPVVADVVAQLEALYAEREQLEQELGFSDSDTIVEMIRRLEAQLAALYREKEES
jgi:hypothetical protein